MLLMATVMLSCRSLPGMARISEKWSGPSKVAARHWVSWCAPEMDLRLTRCSSFSEYGAHLYHTHTLTHSLSLTHTRTHAHTHTHTHAHSLILLYGFISCSARHQHSPPHTHTHTHSLTHHARVSVLKDPAGGTSTCKMASRSSRMSCLSR